MTYLSVCSGIEAATVASKHLGWTPVGFAEIDPFCCSLLKYYYPDVPNYGDFTKITAEQIGPVDAIVGGTPCQDFSVAGLRAGMDGARGSLTLEFVRLVERIHPRWVFWENVPGVLSIDGGRAFGAFLGALAELGYGFAYRVLDAQYFGVPQRRRRVFVVGHLGNWRYPASVLFERESLSGDYPPSREAGQIVTGTISARTCGGGGFGTDFECSGGLVPELAMCLNAHGTRLDAESEALIAHTLSANGFDASEDGTGSGTPLVPVAIQERAVSENPDCGPEGKGYQDGMAYTLEARSSVQAIQAGMAVRRITPREAERLQGLEDDYTLVPYRGKPASDGPRYRALGNSWAVPCVRWIFERMDYIDKL